MLEEIIAMVAQITEEDTNEFDGADRIPDILPDSVSRMDLISRLKERYGVAVSNRQVYKELATISALAIYVENRASSS